MPSSRQRYENTSVKQEPRSVRTCVRRKGGNSLVEKGQRALLGLIVLDRQMHAPRAPVDRGKEITLAALAVARAQFRQMLDVDVHEAEIVGFEPAPPLARALIGIERRQVGETVQPVGFQDPIDAVAVEVWQEMPDREGKVIEGKAGRFTDRADDRPLVLGCFPGQLLRPGRMVEAVVRPTLAPLAYRLGADAIALGQNARGLL